MEKQGLLGRTRVHLVSPMVTKQIQSHQRPSAFGEVRTRLTTNLPDYESLRNLLLKLIQWVQLADRVLVVLLGLWSEWQLELK